MRNFLKTILATISWLFSKVFFLRQNPAILMYHSFDYKDWKYGVHPEDLKKQINYLLKKYEIVSLDEIVRHAQGELKIPNNSVAITIDDGYYDTYSTFFSLAKEMEIPFTLFLTTDLSEKDFFGNLPRPTWDQLKEMHESGLMTVGLHGHSHIHFDKVFNNNVIEGEINESEKLLKKYLNLTPQFVAYPSGKYNSEVLQYFRTNNYLAGVTTKSGFVKEGDELMELRRIEVDRNVPNLAVFKIRLTPALEVYNYITRLLK